MQIRSDILSTFKFQRSLRREFIATYNARRDVQFSQGDDSDRI